MPQDFQAVLNRLGRVPEPFRELAEGVRQAVLIAELDAEMALTRTRKVLEFMVRHIYERAYAEPAGTRPLENLVHRIARDGHLPRRLAAYAGGVRELGNVGTHSFNERMTTEDVQHALDQLLPILDWFLGQECPAATPAPGPDPAENEVPARDTGTFTRAAPAPAAAGPAAAVVPKGLRSFDANDSAFFLDLLPGPRTRHGLPESVWFWKGRIEAVGELTFTVGLLYGPSGCGKSSLVKAGLLPRLRCWARPVYVEATAHDTEARLANALRRFCPDLRPDLDLADSVVALRGCVPEGHKVLIVIDQFEQWLHAHGRELAESKLLAALRQIDGEHAQCLLLVRDDFWAAVSRLFQELGLRMVEGENVAMVDLFDLAHARHVLTCFGRAYGCLPPHPAPLAAPQERFLNQAVQGLSRDGFVVCVRLSLFADMMKTREWTPAALRDAGGTEGVGVRFLEESFTARTAVPEHRGVEKQARAFLEALLPEGRTVIRGRMRPAGELAAACGLADDPRRFARLVEILDRELHIITPTQPEDPGGAGAAVAGGGYYQLTHDYLVPPLQQWLTQERRKTWAGRTALRLEGLAALWLRNRERRYLPSLFEYLAMLVAVPRGRRKPQERALLRAATRFYGAFWVAGAVLLVLAVLLGREATGRMLANRVTKAIYTAQPGELEKLIDQDLPPYRPWADPLLRQELADPNARETERLHASLALLPVDPGQVNYLTRRLLHCAIDELPAIRDSLRPFADRLLPELWLRLHDRREHNDVRFRAGMALAEYAPQAPEWTDHDGDFLADELVNSDRDYQRELRTDLKKLAPRLLTELEVAYREHAKEAAGEAAATALVEPEYGGGDPELLARLAAEATSPLQYKIVYPALREAPLAPALRALGQILAEQPAKDLKLAARVDLGRRRAGAAITLLRLGRPEPAFAVFQVRDDPEALTQFVHNCRALGVTAEELLDCLDRAPDDKARYGLLLALGEYGDVFASAEGAEPRRQALVRTLRDWYANNPSSGVHGACAWLLRSWGVALDKPLDDARRVAAGRREWFVQHFGDGPESLAMTFVVFPPGRFWMGAMEEERDLGEGDQTRHRVRLTRPFALADQEVSRAHLAQFFAETKRGRPAKAGDAAQQAEQSAVGVSWFEAVKFCRWLTKKAGMGEEDQCYDDPDQQPNDSEGNVIDCPLRPERPGFRLPTEAEWEYACRCGTITPFSFGSDQGFLGRYAWFQDNGNKEAQPGGELRPDLRGLFDMHGNAYEWCHDRYAPYPRTEVTDPIGNSTQRSRVLRGGGYSFYYGNCRSAYRLFYLPVRKLETFGFRVARTLPGSNGN